MPPDEETICIYFLMLAVKSFSLHIILAARSAIRFFQRLSFPTLEPATESPRVQALIIGIRKKLQNIADRLNSRLDEDPADKMSGTGF